MIARTHNRRPRQGFTLLEMVVVLFLMTAFAGVAYELCGTSLQMSSRIGDRLNVLATHDAALGQLRRDAWAAAQSKLVNGTLELTAGDQTITWRVVGDALYRTATDAPQRHWPDCGDVSFQLAPGVVIARANIAPNRQSEEFRLTSERQLLTEEAR